MRNTHICPRVIRYAAVFLSCTLLRITGISAQEYLTDDLGHTDWEEVEPGYFIAAELVQQDGDIVIFDILVDFQVQYGRLKGDCGAMTVQVLRLGGFVGSTGSEVVFGDMSDKLGQLHDASAGNPYHTYLNAACEKRAIQS